MTTGNSTLAHPAASAVSDTLALPGHAADPAAHAGAGHGSGKSYTIGFVLSVILTAIPFAMVMSGAFPRATVLPTILAIGVLQILVHLVYFLHMNTKSEGGWNAAALGFTAVITVTLVAGSMWIMQHLNHNMMMVMPG